MYTPSTATTYEKIPLIIWLHGRESRAVSKENFRNSGLIGIIDEWNLDNFNAYVLCPHIITTDDVSWRSWHIKDMFYEIFDEIIKTKNIDTNKIILSGHSMGAIGAYEVANGKGNYYSALAILSGYDTYATKSSPKTDISQFKNIPVKGYVGTIEAGEDELSYNHMIKGFVNTFGKENLTIYNANHAQIPKKAFNEDKNGDNKSDLIEWMLNQKKNN